MPGKLLRVTLAVLVLVLVFVLPGTWLTGSLGWGLMVGLAGVGVYSLVGMTVVELRDRSRR